MPTPFRFDVFLTCSGADVFQAHSLAERLENDGIKVWTAHLEDAPFLSKESEKALSRCRCLVLLLSQDALDTDWPVLERQTVLFRDSKHSERRFIPIRLDKCEVPSSIRAYASINWEPQAATPYETLLAVCRPGPSFDRGSNNEIHASETRLSGHGGGIYSVAISQNGELALSGGADATVRMWNLSDGTCQEIFTGHKDHVLSVAMTPDGMHAVSGSQDGAVRFWSLKDRGCLAVFDEDDGAINSVAISANGKVIVSGSTETTVTVWDSSTKKELFILEGHQDSVRSVAIDSNGKWIVSASADRMIRVWDLVTGGCKSVLRGHTGVINSIAITANGSQIVSGSEDRTVRIWDREMATCIATLEGHTGSVLTVCLTADCNFVISGSTDRTLRVWDINNGRCIANSSPQFEVISGVATSEDASKIITAGTYPSELRIWRNAITLNRGGKSEDARRYTNAKVLLVGESGAGKSALAIRLAEDRWEPATSSSDAVWATQLRISNSDSAEQEREVWLWDFAGQSDYRLIHQLYMDETALAILVFNPQQNDPFEGLNSWDHDIHAASQRIFKKLLVAGRCDRGGLMVSKRNIEAFWKKRDYSGYLETSSNTGQGCDDLRKAIAALIPWEEIPWTTSPRIFMLLKSAILNLRDDGVVLLRMIELWQQLQLRLSSAAFSLEEVRAVVALLAGPGLIWRLEFGDLVLLQPERINAYAAAVVRTIRSHSDELGCIDEQSVLNGKLIYQDMKRLETQDEQLVLRAMHQVFVQRGLCVREHTDSGPLLIFPLYFKRERPEAVNLPTILVSYVIAGAIEEIYTTLVVRLRYTSAFIAAGDWIWRFAAEFKTLDDKRITLQMIKKPEGTGEINVYCDPDASDDSKLLFIGYVHEYLKRKVERWERIRHYICKHCSTLVENRSAIKSRLDRGLTDILCGNCENRVTLLDKIEERFSSNELQKLVRGLDQKVTANIDSESRELILVGHAYSIAGEAGQIFRATPNSDWGIDGEIEFKDYDGKATGKRLYLQLKSGDSYLRERKRDNAEIFTIKKTRHAEYWLNQPCPVMLVIRTSDELIRWMNVTDYLSKYKQEFGAPATEILFKGEMFSATNVQRMRDRFVPIPQA